MPETWVPSLAQEDPPEKETAIHCSTLAWEIPWAEEPGGLQSMGLQRDRYESDSFRGDKGREESQAALLGRNMKDQEEKT